MVTGSSHLEKSHSDNCLLAGSALSREETFSGAGHDRDFVCLTQLAKLIFQEVLESLRC